MCILFLPFSLVNSESAFDKVFGFGIMAYLNSKKMTQKDFQEDPLVIIQAEQQVTESESWEIDVDQKIGELQEAIRTLLQFLDPEFINKLNLENLTTAQQDAMFNAYDSLYVKYKYIRLLHGTFASSSKLREIDVKEFRKRIKDSI